MTSYQVPCKDPDYFFKLVVKEELEGCDARVSPEYSIDPWTNRVWKGSIGKVYFKPDSFRTGVIAHEALHMALAYLRICKVLPSLGDDCDDAEEIIADHTGWFAARLGEIYWNQVQS